MSFIYASTVTVTRVPDSVNVNDHAYEGRIYPLTTIASDIPCSIQQKSQTTKPGTNLPQDLSNDTLWRVYIRRRNAAKGSILIRDVLVDDLGRRFEVLAPYWNSLGHNILCKLITT